MKKKISIISIIIIVCIFTISCNVHATGVDLSRCTSEDLVTTFKTEGITNYDLTKYNINNEKRINIYVFRGNGCINCKNFYQYYVANKLLASHGDKIKIISYEVKNNTENFRLLNTAKTLLNQQASTYATPTVFIGNKTFSGDLVANNNATQKQAEIEDAINALYNSSNRYDIIEEIAGKNVFADNSANVTLTSAEKLDKNYILKVSEVDHKNLKLEDGYDYIVAYDISMYNGNVVVPLNNGSFKIKIPIKAKYDTYKVGYVKDGKIQEILKATYNNGFVEFTTTHLSEYVVYGTTSTNIDTKPDAKPDTKPDTKPGSNQDTTPDTKPSTNNPDSNMNQNTNLNINKEDTTNTSESKVTKMGNMESIKNPQTFDGIETYVLLLAVGCSMLIGSLIILCKKKKI